MITYLWKIGVCPFISLDNIEEFFSSTWVECCIIRKTFHCCCIAPIAQNILMPKYLVLSNYSYFHWMALNSSRLLFKSHYVLKHPRTHSLSILLRPDQYFWVDFNFRWHLFIMTLIINVVRSCDLEVPIINYVHVLRWISLFVYYLIHSTWFMREWFNYFCHFFVCLIA